MIGTPNRSGSDIGSEIGNPAGTGCGKIRAATTLRQMHPRLPSRSTGSARGFFSAVLVLVVALADSWMLCSEGLSSSSSFSSSSSSSSSPSEPSPWASSSWLLELDFGGPSSSSSSSSQATNKEETTTALSMYSDAPPFSSYGATGSRLVVVCPVVIEAEDDATSKKFPDAFVGRGASVVRARTEDDDKEAGDGADDTATQKGCFTYVTMEGSRRIEFSPGGWTLQFPPGGKANRGRASKLRFYLDLETDLRRNDVFLPAGTRLYFAASAWRELDYEQGLAKMRPLKAALEEAQAVLDERLSHETGDRRLDGTDPVETLKAYGDMTGLILDRDRKRAAVRAALDRDGHGYPGSEDLPEGPWPGTTEWLTVTERNPIYARVPGDATDGGSSGTAKKNLLQQLMEAGGEKAYRYGRVGTWTGEAISSLLLDDE